MTNKTPLFLDEFQELADPRSTKNQLYSMSEILLLVLCAVISGSEAWKEIELYGKMKLDFLRTLLPYLNGTPSDDTIRRFFRAIDTDKFQELFRSWINNYVTLGNKNKIIAIDGKSSRGSVDDENTMLHMVSAYATESRLVLGQDKVSDKSNEITAIPRLLEWLDLDGSIVTIDAMGCQYRIADQIKSKNGDYIFALKGNQGNLSDDVKTYFEHEISNPNIEVNVDYDKGHGRSETRRCYVSTEVDWITDRHPNWSTIKSIVRLDCKRELKNKVTNETRYYISSTQLEPKVMLSSIRSHWAIENSLHWVLDMTFGEDQSRIKKDNAPQAMAIIRHIALNLLQMTKANMKRQSIKGLRKMAGWNNDILTTIISQTV